MRTQSRFEYYRLSGIPIVFWNQHVRCSFPSGEAQEAEWPERSTERFGTLCIVDPQPSIDLNLLCSNGFDTR